MELILLQRVEKLGQMGDVVKVKPGYGRNFLLPRGKAIRATQEKIEEFKTKRSQLEANNLKLKKEAEAVAEKMRGLSLVILRSAGESGHLYGSIRSVSVRRCKMVQATVLFQMKFTSFWKDYILQTQMF